MTTCFACWPDAFWAPFDALVVVVVAVDVPWFRVELGAAPENEIASRPLAAASAAAKAGGSLIISARSRCGAGEPSTVASIWCGPLCKREFKRNDAIVRTSGGVRNTAIGLCWSLVNGMFAKVVVVVVFEVLYAIVYVAVCVWVCVFVVYVCENEPVRFTFALALLR